EAGFFPGMVVYLSLWFPKAWLGRVNALFLAAPTVAVIISGPIASVILGLDGAAGIRGWQWLFLLEGLPACFIAVAVLKYIPDGPAQASWLTQGEQKFMSTGIETEGTAKNQSLWPALRDPRVLLLGLALGG